MRIGVIRHTAMGRGVMLRNVIGQGRVRFMRAMTLVEVLAVVVILGLLAATLATGFSGSFGKGRREVARTAIAQIMAKLEIYNLEHHAWPTNEGGLSALGEGHATPSAPYFLSTDHLLDPWGRPYQYATPGPGGLAYEVVSFGSDGVPGGEGEGADLSSASLRAK